VSKKKKRKPKKKQPWGYQPNSPLTKYLYRIKVLVN
jgi:hypothetical protein